MRCRRRRECFLQVHAVAGTGECLECRTLISWKYTWEEIDATENLRCPLCSGPVQIHENSVVPELVSFSRRV